MTHFPTWSRRDAIRMAAWLTAAAGTPVAARSVVRKAARGGPALKGDAAFLDAVSQTMIPRTATPGAGDVHTGAFVAMALAHGLHGARQPLAADTTSALRAYARPDGSLDHIAWLRGALDRRAAPSFLAATPARRHTALAALDAEAFAAGGDHHPWHVVKALILTGYYTSEAGGSQELRYEAVPGRYDPDLPVAPQTRAISNDWTAVDFG